jgi:protein-S-isoprenylcysteine O-methyltransferase Ste14
MPPERGSVVSASICHGASDMHVAGGQKVISTGPYAIVRHTMCAGVLVTVVETPLALGS